jgi:hypothetical protein
LATKTVFCWAFLPRVQSEATPALRGTASDIVELAPHKHSAVWLNLTKNVVAWRLQRRKHRPNGSLLKRQCECNDLMESGIAEPEAYCIFHRLLKHMSSIKDGECLWTYTAYQFCQALRSLLSQLGETRAQSLTLKAFRAGRATHMASAGCSLGDILLAGEWRSAAFLKYVQIDTVDQAILFQECIDSGDD